MSTERKLSLEKADHWEDWEQELLRKAAYHKILGIVKGLEEPLAEPPYPTPPSDIDAGPKPMPRMVPRTGTVTRSQSSASTVTPGPDDLVLQPPSEEEKRAYEQICGDISLERHGPKLLSPNKALALQPGWRYYYIV
ncbi:hypothetical protein EPUS_04756 [Endocarpon pusillum Z07020]|uniref:Uncharacterized protein n=1 Tax=Endocarpon pusillum (strain Z07020 / HMAS-L-300199) TaxID=1263415 RepID=U1GKI5_ENDPU|nr:uncharacterized protein EPUS_04756 [Endocarpon pusillum Z07020]ERF72703.1 hypothetical protein EPUS_04756 [Endocarpon pusillum Z07020]